ncbi:MAG: helix-turn-helix transcriptional regulator [Sulfurospirillaceae bacterium]|jgi:predicted transcriptional regulator|nr:helix-turn-helix transcriptional regulator [Sulfurospirillaceae bacterium]MCK9546699.1 helix-turn-helix transcriptional regulator [Sulfurospirillaceae bacterium]MDY0238625.1 helix-turn-helix transcriptional regulator [Campylobacterales bacterium]
MTRIEFIKKIEERRKQLDITIENLAKLSGLGTRTVNRFFAGEDVKLSTVEKITTFLGTNLAGDEKVSIKKLKKNRAAKRALFMASLVQSTSALEKQGLEKKEIGKMTKEFENQFLTGLYKDRLWID